MRLGRGWIPLIAAVLPVCLDAQAGAGRIPPGSLATFTSMWRLDSACTAGALSACDTLGMHHMASRDKEDHKKAASIWERACSAGGAGACANLALAYDDGEGVHRDRTRALTMSQDACERGASAGCVGAASLLSDGRAGPKDLTAGNGLLEQACSLNDLYGCLNLGYRSLDGSFGFPRDSNAARTYLAKACAAVVPDHPYGWYRETGREACSLARQLAQLPPS